MGGKWEGQCNAVHGEGERAVGMQGKKQPLPPATSPTYRTLKASFHFVLNKPLCTVSTYHDALRCRDRSKFRRPGMPLRASLHPAVHTAEQITTVRLSQNPVH